MPIDHADFVEGKPVRVVSALAMLFLAWMLLPGADSLAQGAPPFVVTAQTTLASYTYPTSPPAPVLQGAGFGTLAVNKFGDVFIGGYNSNTVLEFPASGANPVIVYNASSGGHAGAVAIDPNQNLIVTERFNDFIYMIPYYHGSYTPFTYSAPPAPPNCTQVPTSAAACNYDSDFLAYQNSLGGAVTGYYYQPLALTFDGAGNSYMASASDNEGGNNIYECTVACNFASANNSSLLYHHFNYVDSLVSDFAGDLFFADGTGIIYELKAGAKAPITLASAFLAAQGVSLDQAGNLYVSDAGSATVPASVYQIPLENGSLNASNMSLLFPVPVPVTTPVTPNCTQPSGYDQPIGVCIIGVAVDQHGNVFATQDYNFLYKYSIDNASLPATSLGKTSAGVTLTLAFNHKVTLQSSSIASAGALSTEFAVTSKGKGSCVNGTAYNAGETCTITATFSPARPGLRTAILTLTDTAGAAVQVSLSGTGTGQAITLDPGAQSAIGSGLKSPGAVAVDAAGNVFVADAAANTVNEYALGTGPATPVGSGLKEPGGVATDAAGNLYISDTGNDRVVMVPNSNGTLKSSAQSTLLTDLKSPGQLAVDSNGTLYIPEEGNDDVVTYIGRSALGSIGLTSTPVSGLKSPAAVTVDASGNLYIADTGNNRVVEFSDGSATTVGTGLSGPTGVALDASGSVIVADNGNGRIVRVPSENGVLAASNQTTVAGNSVIASPFAVQLDATGNLFATDSDNGAAYVLNRTMSSIDFGRVNGGTSSAEETVVLASSGTAGLTLGSPLYPALPAGSPFLVSPLAANGCTGITTLASGYSCSLGATFEPSKTISGLQNYTVNFTTGAQNTSAPSLALSGTAVNLTSAAVALVQTEPTNGNASYGSPVTVMATVTSKSGTGPTPTGTVTFIVDGAGGKPQSLNSVGSVSIALSLSGGTHDVAAQYSGDAHYAPLASSPINVVIEQDASTTALAIAACVSDPLSSAPNNATNNCDSVTMTATVAPSVPGQPTGQVTFSSGGKSLGTATVTGTTNGSSTVQYQAVLTTNSLPVGTYNVRAVYSGDSDYSTSTSAATELTITPPTFILSASTTSLTASSKSPDSNAATITITSYSNFQGTVDFSCSGLPTNAYCKFIPAVISLIPATSGPQNVPALTTALQVQIDQPPVVTPTGIFWWSGLVLGLGLLLSARSRKARRKLWMLGISGCVLLISAAGISGCGSGASFTTPSGSSTVTVTAVATPASVGGANPNPANNVTSTLVFHLTVQ